MAERATEKRYALPEAQLGRYRGLSAECAVRPVTEGQIKVALETLRMRAAKRQPETGPAARGDDAVLDFAGFTPEGVPIPDSSQKNVKVHLGAGKMLPGVEAKICGHRAGETFDIDFTYPQDFRVEALSGTQAKFRIVLHSVERLHRPPLDDAFAVSQGCADLAALKEKVREEKREMHARMAKRAVRSVLLEQAGQNLEVRFPPEMLDALVEQKMAKLEHEVAARGSTLKQYFQVSHQSEAIVRAQMREEAENGLRRRLAVEKIAEKEKITVSSEEIEAEYGRLAEQGHAEEETLRRMLTESAVRGAVMTEKVCDLLVSCAQLKLTEKAKEE